METEKEFYSNTINNKDCLIWTRALDKKGYGILVWKGEKNKRAHRLSYELNIGEIPKGLFICHSCDTPACINPHHLWLGTPKQNTQDMIKKGRGNFKKGFRFYAAPFRPNTKL